MGDRSLLPQELYAIILRNITDGATFTSCREVCTWFRDTVDNLFPRGNVIFAHNLNMVLKISGDIGRKYAAVACGRPHANMVTRSLVPECGRGNKWRLDNGEVTKEYFVHNISSTADTWCKFTVHDLDVYASHGWSQKQLQDFTIFNRGFEYDARVWDIVQRPSKEQICGPTLETNSAIFVIRNDRSTVVIPFIVTDAYVDALVEIHPDDDWGGITLIMLRPGFTYAHAKRLRGLYECHIGTYASKIIEGWRPQTTDDWVQFYQERSYIHERKSILKDIPAAAVDEIYAHGHTIYSMVMKGIPASVIPLDILGIHRHNPRTYGYVGKLLTSLWCSRVDMDWIWMRDILAYLPQKSHEEYIRTYVITKHTYK
jgi:hypothetical protein